MRCDIHCPPAARRMAVRGAGILAVVVAVRLAYLMVASVIEAVALTIFGACAAGMVVLVRLVRYGGWRKPAQVASSAQLDAIECKAELVRAPYEIPAPPLAIAPPVVTGVVVAARAGERVER